MRIAAKIKAIKEMKGKRKSASALYEGIIEINVSVPPIMTVEIRISAEIPVCVSKTTAMPSRRKPNIMPRIKRALFRSFLILGMSNNLSCPFSTCPLFLHQIDMTF